MRESLLSCWSRESSIGISTLLQQIRLSVLLVVFIATFNVGCVECKHPLADESDSYVEPRMVGKWFYEADEESYLDVRVHPSKKTLMQYRDNIDKKWIEFAVTKLGDGVYVSTKRVKEDPVVINEIAEVDLELGDSLREDEDSDFIYRLALVKFENNGDFHLRIPVDDDLLKVAIKQKKLSGSGFKIDSSKKALREFIANSDPDSLFDTTVINLSKEMPDPPANSDRRSLIGLVIELLFNLVPSR